MLYKRPEGYREIFPRIQQARWVDEGVVHIQLAMPLLFKSRDYVSVFEVDKRRDEWRLRFFPSPSHQVGVDDDVVRLSNYSGLWSLRPHTDGGISVHFY